MGEAEGCCNTLDAQDSPPNGAPWASDVSSAVGLTWDPVQHASAVWSGVLCTLTPLSSLFTQLDVRSVSGPLSQGLSHPGR